jgi:hypothetical protein
VPGRGQLQQMTAFQRLGRSKRKGWERESHRHRIFSRAEYVNIEVGMGRVVYRETEWGGRKETEAKELTSALLYSSMYWPKATLYFRPSLNEKVVMSKNPSKLWCKTPTQRRKSTRVGSKVYPISPPSLAPPSMFYPPLRGVL